jgi:hypothetical protein
VVGVVVVFSSREERDVEFVAKVIDREKVKEARTMSSFCPFFFYFWPLFFILFLNKKKTLGQARESAQACWALNTPLAVGGGEDRK